MKIPEPFLLLCVDDNKDNLELMTFIFEEKGFQVIVCDSLPEGLAQPRQNQFAAIILDNRFGEQVLMYAGKSAP